MPSSIPARDSTPPSIVCAKPSPRAACRRSQNFGYVTKTKIAPLFRTTHQLGAERAARHAQARHEEEHEDQLPYHCPAVLERFHGFQHLRVNRGLEFHLECRNASERAERNRSEEHTSELQ